jgi:hypothetical protein
MLPVWLSVWFKVWFMVWLELLIEFNSSVRFEFVASMFGSDVIGTGAFIIGPEMLDLAGPSTCCSGFDLGVGIFIGTIKSGEGVTREACGTLAEAVKSGQFLTATIPCQLLMERHVSIMANNSMLVNLIPLTATLRWLLAV